MKTFRFPLLSAAILAALPATSKAALSIYLSANDIESAEASGIIGVTTETFDVPAIGSVDGYVGTVGTYTGFANVLGNDQYGGDGEGNYLGISSGNSVTLTLSEGVQYFGIYFTAGNGGNSFEIKSGGVTILSFNTASLLSLLPNTPGATITAINGTPYNTQDYYGQPVSGSNAAEPYAYLHIVATGGTTFDQIVLSEALNSATFENDNHSIRATAPETIPGTLVNVTGSIPEPSSALLGSIALLGLLRRRRP